MQRDIYVLGKFGFSGLKHFAKMLELFRAHVFFALFRLVRLEAHQSFSHLALSENTDLSLIRENPTRLNIRITYPLQPI